MGFLDFILLLFLGYGAFRGFTSGFFTELASLVSLIVGIYAAIKFSHLVAPWLAKTFAWELSNAKLAAFALTLVAVIIAVSLLARVLTGIVNWSGAGILNKIAGAVFGALKLALIVGIVLNLIVRLNENGALIEKTTIENSLLFEPLQKSTAWFYPWIWEKMN